MGGLEGEAFGRAEVLEERAPPLPLREARERQDIGAAVAELREEARDRLRCVIGAHDEELALARDRVLGDHAQARLHVALAEVADRHAEGLLEVGGHAVDPAP